MIEISNLTKQYRGSSAKAVENLSLTINGGEIFGFLGPNGAGKSTTIKCITGILPYTEGHIRICGDDLAADSVKAKKHIGFVPDEHLLYEALTGLQYINFIADIYEVEASLRKERISKYEALFGMEGKLDNKISTYSHGMKQKTSLIAALVHDPEIWILDEPMTGLDPKSAYHLKQLMAEHAKSGKTVFFSSHVLDVVEKICTRVAIIDKGKLVTVCDMQELSEKRGDISLEQLFLTLTRSEGESNDNP